MSKTNDLLQHYREVRLRLRYPPNAVPDTGINLRRAREPVALLPPPEPTLPSAESIPASSFREYQPFVSTSLTFSSTIAISAAEFGLTAKDLHKKCRTRAICFPRQVAIYIAAKQGRWAASWMAHRLDLDHSTVLHAQRKIATLVETNAALRERIANIEAEIATRYRPAPPALNECDLAQGSERSDLPE